MCKRQLIVVMPDEKDRRFVHYLLSDAAQEIVAELVRKRELMNRKILEGISEEELQVFREVSEKIKKNMENMI